MTKREHFISQIRIAVKAIERQGRKIIKENFIVDIMAKSSCSRPTAKEWLEIALSQEDFKLKTEQRKL